ncbi:MAG: lysine--tRNA ligase, partial [Nanoarchaeota archaeon]|nr:lysine--tRNA ligase [Nanoarchaeota archaeon]
MNPEEQLVNDRIAKIKRLKEKGIEPYPYNFDKKNDAIDLFSKFNSLNAGEHSKSKVKVAGRMLSLRLMGGAAFAHILDNTGKIQLYFAKNNLKNYKDLKLFDMGDFIGVEGVIFKTKKGELSIEVKKFKLLSKSLRPLPEKWHGLQDTEIRYRKRYLDFISNPEVKQVFEKRAKILSLIRQFMEKKGFVEVDIPVLQPIYGGASAKPFKTHINAWDLDLFLSISPELYLKRLIIGGFE